MSIALYHGDEEYRLQQAVRAVRTQTVNPDMGHLGHKRLQNPSIGDALEAIGAVYFNLGGGKTLIELHEFAFLSKAAGSTADEKQLADLMDLLEHHDDSKHILFVSTKINRSVKFAKWLTGHKTLRPEIQEFKQLAFYQTDEAVRLVLEDCKAKGLRIETKAAQLLVESLGTSLRPLMIEIDKLALYAHGRAITVQDVTTLSNHNENTFGMLADWLHNRNRASIFHTLDELLLRQHPIQLFGLIQSQLGHHYQLQYWQHRGMSQAQIAEATKKHPYKIKMDLQEFGRVPFQRLDTLRQRAIELEWQSKTGQLDARLALEMLLGA